MMVDMRTESGSTFSEGTELVTDGSKQLVVFKGAVLNHSALHIHHQLLLLGRTDGIGEHKTCDAQVLKYSRTQVLDLDVFVD